MRQCKDKGHISHPQEKPQSTSTGGRGGRGSRWVHYIGGGWGGACQTWIIYVIICYIHIRKSCIGTPCLSWLSRCDWIPCCAISLQLLVKTLNSISYPSYNYHNSNSPDKPFRIIKATLQHMMYIYIYIYIYIFTYIYI